MKKAYIILPALAIVFLATSLLAQDVKKTDNLQYIPTDKATMGYLAEPSTAGKHPALVMIHEWWGLNADIKSVADKYAKLGFVVLAVDLYQGKSTADPKEAGALAGGVGANNAPALANLKAAVDFLKAKSNVDSAKVGSIGWCFGGGWSLQMAKNDLGVKTTVMYYGSVDADGHLEHMRAEIIGHFAANDRVIKLSDVNQFQVSLKNKGITNEVYIYPNTSHGFASREGSNPGFDKEAATLADKRTLDFLNKYLVN